MEFAWNNTFSIIARSIIERDVDFDFEALVTVYNPNRLSININEISGSLTYKGHNIGATFE
jgi:hypothetical protein